MDNKPLVIGLTGPFGSGKTTAANFFEKKGFIRITLSSFLEKELLKQRIEPNRTNLQNLGDKWRSESGANYLAKVAIDYINSEKIKKASIDGIRNLAEIEEFKNKLTFKMLGIVADRDVRFERTKELNKKERINRKQFDEMDLRDLGISEDMETGLQVAKCLALSDHYIDSNSGYDNFYKDLEEFLKKL